MRTSFCLKRLTLAAVETDHREARMEKGDQLEDLPERGNVAWME